MDELSVKNYLKKTKKTSLINISSFKMVDLIFYFYQS